MYSTLTVRVTVTYVDTLIVVGNGGNVRVTVADTDTLIEIGYVGNDSACYSTHTVTYCLLGGVWLLCHMKYYAGGSICTWTARILPLCQCNYGFLNGTVTKHGSTGHGCPGSVPGITIYQQTTVLRTYLLDLACWFITRSLVSVSMKSHDP